MLDSAFAYANAPVPAKAGRIRNCPIPRKTKSRWKIPSAFCLVRETGLEPVRCEPHAPQTCASASSATPAYHALPCATLVLYTFCFQKSIPFSKKVLKNQYFFLFPKVTIKKWGKGAVAPFPHCFILCYPACSAPPKEYRSCRFRRSIHPGKTPYKARGEVRRQKARSSFPA